MSESGHADHGSHPDELLAGYVDGSATEQERALVDVHLASCPLCRDDLSLAHAARAALATLPDVEAPGIAAAGLAGLGIESQIEPPPGFTFDKSRRRRAPKRTREWGRIAWGAGLAAAASLVVIFAVSVLSGPRRAVESTGPGGKVSRPAVNLPPLAAYGTDWTPSSLDRFASTLAGEYTRGNALGPGAAPADSGSATSEQAVSCLRRGAGLASTLQPVYLEAATFQGTPAFIGAFVEGPATSGASSHLVLVAVDRQSCDPVYLARTVL